LTQSDQSPKNRKTPSGDFLLSDAETPDAATRTANGKARKPWRAPKVVTGEVAAATGKEIVAQESTSEFASNFS